jgi:hypothetical protein
MDILMDILTGILIALFVISVLAVGYYVLKPEKYEN